MNSYVDSDYYLYDFGGKIPAEKIIMYLKLASKHIDTLTFNRIVTKGFEKLTNFQQNIIKDTVCMLAEFEYENEDILSSPLSNYSINSVAIGFGKNWNIEIQNGIAIPKNVYYLLAQTGLTCRNVRC